MLLNTLRKIVQEANSAKDLKAALGIIVRVKGSHGYPGSARCTCSTPRPSVSS